MKAFAEANDQHLSSFIRSACVEVLRREMPTAYPRIPSAAEVDARLMEMVR
jgi:predicted DNA-binding ribbon-helix-helix protein